MNTNLINWNHLPGEDNINRFELPNGITLLCKSDFISPSIVMSGYFQGGSIQDPADKLGLALFTSLGLMRGTTNLRFKRIYNNLESAGASFGFGASVQSTSFGGKSLIEDLPLLLKTLSNCIRWPIFPPQQIRRLRAQLISGLQLRQQDTSDMASLKFDELLFPNHPYGLPEDGYLDTVQRISRRDLVSFHQKYYGPKGMIIVLVGAILPDQALDLVYKALGGWENLNWIAPLEIPDFDPIVESKIISIPIEGKVQTDVILGCHGPSRISDDFLPASIGNNILGQFGMMGRIGTAVREKSGLAYYASTSLNAWFKGGSWEISAGVNPLNLNTAINLIMSEIKKFTNELVSEEELEDAKSSYIGSLPLSVESNNGVASAIIRMERFNLGLNYLREFPSMIEKTTREDILRIARKYINPEKIVIVSAGPEISTESELILESLK